MTHTATGNNWNRAYQYSTTNNKLLGTSALGDPAGAYSNTYTYNTHGSMITMPHISQLNWNHAEQLQSTALGGGGIVYFCYDSSGNRSRKVYEHSGIIEDRIYLGGYEIYRRTVGTTLSLERQTLHVTDDTKRVMLFETKTVDVNNSSGLPQIRSRWQLDNHLGTSSIELNDNAQVISYEEYHPFGSTSFHTVDSGAEVSAKRYRYTGKERDDETGLYYYGARYYAAWLGRWTGCDPFVKDGWNLYVYVRNNPIVYNDPDGNQRDSTKLKTNVGIFGLFSRDTTSTETDSIFIPDINLDNVKIITNIGEERPMIDNRMPAANLTSNVNDTAATGTEEERIIINVRVAQWYNDYEKNGEIHRINWEDHCSRNGEMSIAASHEQGYNELREEFGRMGVDLRINQDEFSAGEQEDLYSFIVDAGGNTDIRVVAGHSNINADYISDVTNSSTNTAAHRLPLRRLSDRLGLGGPSVLDACGTRRNIENYKNLRPLEDQFYIDDPETPYNDYKTSGNEGALQYIRSEANRIVNERVRK